MATPVAPPSVRWHRFRLAETDASDLVSAACYRTPEHVGIRPIIIAKLKFCDVEREILGADFVKRADHAALEDRPKAFNRVGVDRADYIFVIRVADYLVLVTIDLLQAVVADPLIGEPRG
jgi:hypothetical protein